MHSVRDLIELVKEVLQLPSVGRQIFGREVVPAMQNGQRRAKPIPASMGHGIFHPMGPNLRLSSQRQCCLQEGRNSCHTSAKTPGKRRGSRSRTPSERTLRVSRNLKAFGHRTSSSIPGRLLASLWAARWSSSRHFAIAGRETASWAPVVVVRFFRVHLLADALQLG